MHRSVNTATITNVLAHVRSLALRQARDSAGLFLIEGVRQFLWAHEAGFDFDTILHSRVLLQNEIAQKLVRGLVEQGVRRAHLSPERFRSISTAPRASGIAHSRGDGIAYSRTTRSINSCSASTED